MYIFSNNILFGHWVGGSVLCNLIHHKNYTTLIQNIPSTLSCTKIRHLTMITVLRYVSPAKGVGNYI